jgi:2-methylaconitate cis-trans-isomerase PrpF
MKDGHVVEEGDFLLDGVAFPAAKIKLESLDPGGMEGAGTRARCSSPGALPIRWM